MTGTTHPAAAEAGGNRGLPIACPACDGPALKHDDGSIYCSDMDKTYTAEQMVRAAMARSAVTTYRRWGGAS
jgi:uncharacterized Zn finger protein (UPF0148 family)